MNGPRFKPPTDEEIDALKLKVIYLLDCNEPLAGNLLTTKLTVNRKCLKNYLGFRGFKEFTQHDGYALF